MVVRHDPARRRSPEALTVLREWGRIGCVGFGGPPTHIRLLRELCVERRGWIEADEFEDAIATCNLLPGPASTQLAIFCAWRVRGRVGALLGGGAFILPGLVLILVLAGLFLGSPPRWILAAGAGAGAAVAAVAVHAAAALIPASWRRREHDDQEHGSWSHGRWLGYVLAGAVAAAAIGAWVVLALLLCGLAESVIRLRPEKDEEDSDDEDSEPERRPALPMVAVGTTSAGALLGISWVALKVGALSYGGGFVIIPLMQSDAVQRYHWMTASDFLNAVALGQVTPGPVVLTVAVVGYAASGLAGGLLAAAVAFTPSFAFVLLGAERFDRIRGDRRTRAFLDGAGPAAIGAILGSAIPLAAALSQRWQLGVLAVAAASLLVLRRSVVFTLLAAAGLGVGAGLAGLPLPS